QRAVGVAHEAGGAVERVQDGDVHRRKFDSDVGGAIIGARMSRGRSGRLVRCDQALAAERTRWVSGSAQAAPPRMAFKSFSNRNRWYGSVGLGSNSQLSYHCRAASSLA